MKTEEFDEAIRKKLESFNPTYSNSDVSRVLHHVKKGRRFAWKGVNGSWFIYSLAAAAMVGITTWMVLTPKQKENKIKASATVEIPVKNSKSSVSFKNDSTSGNGSLSVAGQSENETKKAPEAKISANTFSNHNPTSNYTNTVPVLVQSMAANDKSKVSAVKENPVSATDGNILLNPKTKAILQDESRQFQQPDMSTGKTDPIVEANLKADQVAPLLLIKETNVIHSTDSTSLTEVSQTQLTSKSDTVKTGQKITNAGQDTVLPDFRIRATTLFVVSNQKIGTGLAGEILFGSHFGLSAGVTYNWLYTERFIDKADFYGHRPHGSNPQIDNHFGGNQPVSDITIGNQIVQIPVSINYFIPVNKKIVVSLSAGTDFDLYLNQKLSYNHRVDSAHSENPHFMAKGKVIPFNSLFFGAGLEYRWNHLVISAQPYYNLHFEGVFYKPKESEFGLGLGISYSFGK